MEGAAILAYAEPSHWISKSCVIDRFFGDLDQKEELLRVVKRLYRERRLRHRLQLDSYTFCGLVHELRYSPAFQRGFVSKWCQGCGQSTPGPTIILLRLRDPSQFPLDFDWNYKVEALVNRHLELEKLMWHLSTLGGAFSALGDLAVEYAHRAGRISWSQLKIAFLLGDPVTVARCKLYFAISYIQTGRLRQAESIIRQQYRFATGSSVTDNRQLRNACLGVWSKLRYAYELRRSKRMTDRTS